jgi:hypothetical protein
MASKFRGHLKPVVAEDLMKLTEHVPLSADEIKDALTRGRGGIIAAAYVLHVDPLYLKRNIDASEALSAFAASVSRVQKDADWQRISDAEFAARIQEVQLPYKLDTLETLHELTTMEYDSAAMARVKLDAAVALSNAVQPSTTGHQAGPDMEEMNRLYREHAPRIKEIRERVVTFTQTTEPLLLVGASLPASGEAIDADLL